MNLLINKIPGWSGVGDYYEVIFESKYLIAKNKKGTGLWGTKIYTSDSDHLKELLHSQQIKITIAPPPHDSSYVGSNANGIRSYNMEVRVNFRRH